MDNIYTSVIESLIFAADDPINPAEIVKAIKEIDGNDISITLKDVEVSVNLLNDKYNDQGAAFRIVRISNGYTFATMPEYAKYIGFLSSGKVNEDLAKLHWKLYLLLHINSQLLNPN